eukprot:scaffold90505_cov63-Phaeocystis_antarctica.AAC.1
MVVWLGDGALDWPGGAPYGVVQERVGLVAGRGQRDRGGHDDSSERRAAERGPRPARLAAVRRRVRSPDGSRLHPGQPAHHGEERPSWGRQARRARRRERA